MHWPYLAPLCSAGLAALLLALGAARPLILWTLLFAGLVLSASLGGSLPIALSIAVLAGILWLETRRPRSAPPDEPLNRKLFYVFIKKATSPLITATVATIGLDAWRPAWALRSHGWPLWAQSLVVLFAVDLEKYWIHRAQHTFTWWWRFHRVHHLSRDVRAISYAPTHIGEFLVIQAVAVTGLTLLLGVGPRAVIYGYAIPSTLITGLWAHANINLPRGRMPAWAYVVMTPNVHGIHHSQGGTRTNFAEIFTLWDVLFGTFLSSATHHELLLLMGVAGETSTPSVWREQLLEVRTLSSSPRIPAAPPVARRRPGRGSPAQPDR